MIIKLEPNSYRSYFIKGKKKSSFIGDILIALCKSDEAMQVYDSVARLYPDTYEYQIRGSNYYSLLGEKFYKQRKYKEAIQIYDILIKYHPDLNENYLKKGFIQLIF